MIQILLKIWNNSIKWIVSRKFWPVLVPCPFVFCPPFLFLLFVFPQYHLAPCVFMFSSSLAPFPWPTALYVLLFHVFLLWVLLLPVLLLPVFLLPVLLLPVLLLHVLLLQVLLLPVLLLPDLQYCSLSACSKPSCSLSACSLSFCSYFFSSENLYIFGFFASCHFVSHNKFSFSLKAKEAKLTFCFAISLCSFSLPFHFEAKCGDTLCPTIPATTSHAYRTLRSTHALNRAGGAWKRGAGAWVALLEKRCWRMNCTVRKVLADLAMKVTDNANAKLYVTYSFV